MNTELLPFLLALDCFAITALMMAVGPVMRIIRGINKRALIGLFVLVLVRSSYLLIMLLQGSISLTLAGTLEIASICCIAWVLLKPTALHYPLWRRYTRISLLIISLLIVQLWVFPFITWQIAVAIIAFGSTPVVFSRFDRHRWSHIIPSLTLGASALLNNFGLIETGQFITQIGYGTLVYAIFVETAIHASTRQQETETLGLENQRQHTERTRFIETSRLLSASPIPYSLLDHAVKILGQQVKVEQIVLISVDRQQQGRCKISAFHSKPSITNFDAAQTTFAMADYPLLLDALEVLGQLPLHTYNNHHHLLLNKLYSLWNTEKAGPTLLQALRLGQEVVGFLVIGNPFSQHPIDNGQARLCQKLGPQLAAMVAYQEAYQSLETKSADLAALLQSSQGSYEQLSNIVETINDGVIASNIEGRIHLVNKTAERLLGQSRQALLGQPIGTIFSQASEQKSLEKLALEFSRSNKALPIYFEKDNQAVQGKLIPLRNRSQDWLGIVAVLRDVTIEVQTDETKSEFVRTLSKELRTPLTTVKGYLDLMLAGAAGTLDIQQKHFLQVIKAGADKATRIINEAQQTVDGESNIIKLDVKKIDLQKVIEASSQEITPLVSAKKLHFKQDVAPNLPFLQADEAKLRQIITNLLINACQLTPEKGIVALSAWTHQEGSNGHEADYLMIAVADNGVGISNQDQQQILASTIPPAQQLAQKKPYINLELSAVKNLVEAHGGRLWVESIEGKGSLFQVTLPCTLNQVSAVVA